ncbi:MAG: phenylalanine--tRNA ligase subunit beta, partial [Candidatus Omnitrophica bacterium]|nr:phenylalanine--tRNA ligase subunit beta [Candidatus Omnitrophota bacterium]
MKIPLEWLKEYVAIRGTPRALAQRLTMAGLEVAGIGEADGQTVFDVEVTPNRADCLSIIGVAREVAAITGQRLTLPQRQATRDKQHGKTKVQKFTIAIEDRKGCSRYIGRLIEGVAIKPSPDWMQRRLLACGARPINNLVDITNYVLLE